MTLLNLYGWGRRSWPNKWFLNWRDKKVSITLYFLRSTLYLHLLAKKRILAVRQLAVFRAEHKKICELR